MKAAISKRQNSSSHFLLLFKFEFEEFDDDWNVARGREAIFSTHLVLSTICKSGIFFIFPIVHDDSDAFTRCLIILADEAFLDWQCK